MLCSDLYLIFNILFFFWGMIWCFAKLFSFPLFYLVGPFSIMCLEKTVLYQNIDEQEV